MKEMTYEEWTNEAKSLFGDDVMKWRFVCPACGHVASVQDYFDAGAPSGAIAFSCIGRYSENPRDAFDKSKPGPCNYTNGDLIRLGPVLVDGQHTFDFAREGEA